MSSLNQNIGLARDDGSNKRSLTEVGTVLGSLVMSSQVKNSAFVFVKLHTVLASPLFQPVQFSP